MWKDYFDYWCLGCNNYVLLEISGKLMLEGRCALCGLGISMSYEAWKKQDRERNE